MKDEDYMRLCLELAKRGALSVAPNPMVGCVIVHGDTIIGQGFHQSYGAAHAEVEAIQSVSESALLSESTLYVNLEPCSHQGKTPPCSKLLISKALKRVVVGCLDVNPKVEGRGIAQLNAAGIDTKVSVLEPECRELNRRFETFHLRKRPYIILKWAQTQDGFLAKKDGHSKWISNEQSRALVHQWRAEESAIIVGTNTAASDDPALTVRHVQGNNPLRIVLDRRGRLSAQLQIFDGSTPTLLVNEQKRSGLPLVDQLQLSFGDTLLPDLLEQLYSKQVLSLFVEGGAQLLNSFVEQGLWDEARVFTAEKEFQQGIAAPRLNQNPKEEHLVGTDVLRIYSRT